MNNQTVQCCLRVRHSCVGASDCVIMIVHVKLQLDMNYQYHDFTDVSGVALAFGVVLSVQLPGSRHALWSWRLIELLYRYRVHIDCVLCKWTVGQNCIVVKALLPQKQKCSWIDQFSDLLRFAHTSFRPFASKYLFVDLWRQTKAVGAIRLHDMKAYETWYTPTQQWDRISSTS